MLYVCIAIVSQLVQWLELILPPSLCIINVGFYVGMSIFYVYMCMVVLWINEILSTLYSLCSWILRHGGHLMLGFHLVKWTLARQVLFKHTALQMLACQA